ncbi:ATP-grasp domain-containing protein [Methanosphaera sp. ISO3-F5]|uniref:ATP-grasp domain-containing protein n=1 Tax=Methanosphaera sp. ISO3-F5 TaxID=1452353 RepID=UPI002B25F7F1|nr:ATP-grasp domain-containing protein [Methanosphaera sp. ISO3-F5]WQH64494.1 ATP-grasp domain-containing protein [Methanosphaera sp. ISO3-F5]
MKILFIGSRLFDDAAWYAKKHEIETIITESNEKAMNLDLADKKYIVPRGMEEPINIAIKEDVDAVIPLIGIDPPLTDVGLMKEKLEKENNIPVIAASSNTAQLAANKYDTKQMLTKNNIKTPKFKKLEKPYQIQDLENELPIVLKTPDGQGGVGVKIALNTEDIQDFIKDKNNIFTEKFVQGTEISIETLRWKEQTIALAPVYKGDTTLEGTHPLSKIKQAPLNISGIDNQQHNQAIRDLAEKLADMVKVEGTMDIDILHDARNNENYVIELNTRPSGTRYMTAATTNIYPICQLIDMACGTWSPENVKKEMKSYYATELPVGDFPENRQTPKIKQFSGENSYIVHGPKHYQRVTIRANSKENLNNLTYELVPDYARENNIKFI